MKNNNNKKKKKNKKKNRIFVWKLSVICGEFQYIWIGVYRNNICEWRSPRPVCTATRRALRYWSFIFRRSLYCPGEQQISWPDCGNAKVSLDSRLFAYVLRSFFSAIDLFDKARHSLQFWALHLMRCLIIGLNYCLTGKYGRPWSDCFLPEHVGHGVRSLSSPATFFRRDWSWNIFYGHSLPSAGSRRDVISFWRKNVHKYW